MIQAKWEIQLLARAHSIIAARTKQELHAKIAEYLFKQARLPLAGSASSPPDTEMLNDFLSILKQHKVTPEEFHTQIERERLVLSNYAGYAGNLLKEIGGQ